MVQCLDLLSDTGKTAKVLNVGLTMDSLACPICQPCSASMSLFGHRVVEHGAIAMILSLNSLADIDDTFVLSCNEGEGSLTIYVQAVRASWP